MRIEYSHSPSKYLKKPKRLVLNRCRLLPSVAAHVAATLKATPATRATTPNPLATAKTAPTKTGRSAKNNILGANCNEERAGSKPKWIEPTTQIRM